MVKRKPSSNARVVIDKQFIQIGNIQSINWKNILILTFVLFVFGSSSFYLGHRYLATNYNSTNSNIYSNKIELPTATPTAQPTQLILLPI